MILKDISRRDSPGRSRQIGIWALGGIGALVALFLLSYFIIPSSKGGDEYLFCGAEQVKGNLSQSFFYHKGNRFHHGETRSSETSRTGNYASKTDKSHPNGMTYYWTKPPMGSRYHVVVWRKKAGAASGKLTISVYGKKSFTLEEEIPSETDEAGWDKVELMISLPLYEQMDSMVISTELIGNGITYFDDLSIERLNTRQMRFFGGQKDTVLNTLSLFVKEKGMQELEQRRKRALEKGILITESDSWVKAHIQQSDTTLDAEIRLKGDWTDHLRSDKWSFRIKLSAPYSWNRLRTFSIQRPQSRYFLHEWMYHQWLEMEGVLTTTYDFLDVKLNRESKGLYALEEHFDKRLLESRDRREGPILKFEESAVWEARLRKNQLQTPEDMENSHHTFESSAIEPFQANKILADSLLNAQFTRAQILLNQVRFQQGRVSEIFDIDKLARYYAIIDFTQAYHSLVWHNLRFYYNPVTGKLEPIGFDGFTEVGPFTAQYRGSQLVGAGRDIRNKDLPETLHTWILSDSLLMEKYLSHLYQFSDPKYIQKMLGDFAPAMEHRLSRIQEENSEYQYSGKQLINRARLIRNWLMPLKANGIQAYRSEPRSSSISVANLHRFPVRVIGFGNEKAICNDSLSQPLWLTAYAAPALPNYHQISVPTHFDFVFFELPGTGKVFSSKIHQQSFPDRNKLLASSDKLALPQSSIVQKIDSLLIFQKGNHVISKSIMVPSGYVVQMEPGCHLDLIRGAGIVLRSPVFLTGTEEQPIRIYSSDKTGQGFTVLQAHRASTISYTRFEQLDTWKQPGWTLTGGVTFYESDVSIDHSSFINNHCEDALNLIRSEFEISNSLVSHTFSDGIDIDFCSGTIRNTRCQATGNDGMDISGSQVNVVDCEIVSAGDKGISVGEQAHVQIKDVIIQSSPMGIAAKDLSIVEVNQVKLVDCKTGFAAYQKKSEYGGGFLRIKAYEAENITFLYQVEPGSEIRLKGRVIKGK